MVKAKKNQKERKLGALLSKRGKHQDQEAAKKILRARVKTAPSVALFGASKRHKSGMDGEYEALAARADGKAESKNRAQRIKASVIFMPPSFMPRTTDLPVPQSNLKVDTMLEELSGGRSWKCDGVSCSTGSIGSQQDIDGGGRLTCENALLKTNPFRLLEDDCNGHYAGNNGVANETPHFMAPSFPLPASFRQETGTSICSLEREVPSVVFPNDL